MTRLTGRAGQRLLDRLPRGAVRRAPVRRAGRAALRRRPLHARRHAPTTRWRAAAARGGLRRALRQQLGASRTYFCARTGPRARDARAPGRATAATRSSAATSATAPNRSSPATGLIPGALRRGLLEPILLGLPGRPAPDLLGQGPALCPAGRSIPNPRPLLLLRVLRGPASGAAPRPGLPRGGRSADGPSGIARAALRRASRPRRELNRLLYLDLKITIGDNDLFKVTRTAELAGVAVRFPLLDPAAGGVHRRPCPRDTRCAGHGEAVPLQARVPRLCCPPRPWPSASTASACPSSDWLRTHRAFRELARDTLLSAPEPRQRGYFAPRRAGGALPAPRGRPHARSTAICCGRSSCWSCGTPARRRAETPHERAARSSLSALVATGLYRGRLAGPAVAWPPATRAAARLPDPDLSPGQRRARPVLPVAAHRGLRARRWRTSRGTTWCCRSRSWWSACAGGTCPATRWPSPSTTATATT